MKSKSTHFGIRKGFTLIESLLAAVVLAATIAAITVPFTAAARNEQYDGRQTMAVSLATEMMEEILSKPFEDPDGASVVGPEGNEPNRAAFDNMDDYHGYAEAAGGVADAANNAIVDPTANGLSRNVTVAYIYVTGQDTSLPPTFVRITVDVQYNGAVVAQLTRLAYHE